MWCDTTHHITEDLPYLPLLKTAVFREIVIFLLHMGGYEQVPNLFSLKVELMTSPLLRMHNLT
jgi:hypothetical protein